LDNHLVFDYFPSDAGAKWQVHEATSSLPPGAFRQDDELTLVVDGKKIVGKISSARTEVEVRKGKVVALRTRIALRDADPLI
jgi:hypothetical protein